MGYYTTFEGEITLVGLPNDNLEVIKKVIDMIELVQWGCSGAYRSGISINYYTPETEWIHFINPKLEGLTLNLTGERKNYNHATQTFLYLISPYLDENKTYSVSMLGEDEEDGEESYIQIKKNKVYVDDELFATNNQLSFPFPKITYK